MKKFALVCAAFFAAFISAPAMAQNTPPASTPNASTQEELLECQNDVEVLESKLEDSESKLKDTQQKLDICLNEKKTARIASPPKGPPRVEIPVCDETAGALVVEGSNGKECECPDLRTRPVISATKRFNNFDRVTIVCALVDLSILDRLGARITKVEGDVTNLQQEFNNLRNGGIVTAQEFTELENKVNDHEGRIAALEKADREENCKKDGKNCPDAFASSPNEWSIGAFGLGVIRPGGPPPTIGVGGSVGFTGWFNPTNAFQLTGLVGYGFNRDADRAVAGAMLDYVHAFSTAREHRLQLGVMGLVEPGRAGNEAAFFGPRVSYRWVPGGFFLEPSLALGGGKVMLRDADGNRTDQLSGTSLVILPAITAGFSFGGSPTTTTTTTSSSATTGGSVSAETP